MSSQINVFFKKYKPTKLDEEHNIVVYESHITDYLITDYCYHYFATQVKCGMLFLGITLIIQRHYAIFIVTQLKLVNKFGNLNSIKH